MTAYTKSQLVEMTRAAARRYGIREDIAVAQIQAESSFNPNARSGANAQGIAQFIPGTWARFGTGSPYDPVAALEAWGKYMSFLLRRFNGNYSFALAGYNAGEGNVDKYKGVPPFAETRNYVKKILGNAGVTTSSGPGQGIVPTVPSSAGSSGATLLTVAGIALFTWWVLD